MNLFFTFFHTLIFPAGGCSVHVFTASVQLKMVLIKCCDISNEVRPMEVAEPWVDCLLEEYFTQVGPTEGGGGILTQQTVFLST